MDVELGHGTIVSVLSLQVTNVEDKMKTSDSDDLLQRNQRYI